MNDEKENYDPITTDPGKWRFWTQRRYVLAVFVFLGYMNIYSLRVNLSIGIIAMTQNRTVTVENGTDIDIGPEFPWDNKIQGYLLSSFFYGYITTQILGGYLAKQYGGKLVFGAGVFGATIFTLLSPLLAQINVYLLLVARILMGVFEGMTYASLFYLWAKWIPPEERGRITSQSNSGSYTGAVFAMMFYAYLADVAGWESVFYCSGLLALLWCISWFIIISESPENDKKISESELNHIQQSLKTTKINKKNTNVPWKNMITSSAVWALQIALCAETWGFYTLLTLLPKYFKDVFSFDISKSGFISSLPYLFLAAMMQISGQLSDLIVKKNLLTITNTRKMLLCTGYLFQTGFMLGAAFWDNVIGTVFCLIMAVGFGSLAISIISVNSLDIAPQNSSMLFGIVNTWGTIPGIISPIIAGHIVSTENPTVEQWRIVFYITAGFYLFGAITFSIFASGERESWDYDNKKKNLSKKHRNNNKV